MYILRFIQNCQTNNKNNNKKFKDMNQTRRTIGGLALPALLLTLLLFVGQTESRPSTENESDIAVLPPDADNVELHHVKLVNGIMTEDHPVVMYKEDFVDENYEPSKNRTKGTRYTRHHHGRSNVEKQEEKIRFDVLSETPIFDGVADFDSNLNNFEATSLLEPTKKYPKKYHSRKRRQVYYTPARQYYKNTYYVPQQQLQYRTHSEPGPYYLPVEQPRQYQRYPTAGKKPVFRGKLPSWQTSRPPTQPVSVGSRDMFEVDRPEEDHNSLFHNSNPDDADFSVFDRPRPTQAPRPRPTQRPSGGSSSSNSWQSPPDRNPNFNGFQSPPEEVPEDRPVWGQSTGRRPNSNAGNLAPAPAPVFSSPARRRPTYRQDAVFYPEEPSYQLGSSCSRASDLCCNLGNLSSLYDCFQHQKCEQSIAEILSSCS